MSDRVVKVLAFRELPNDKIKGKVIQTFSAWLLDVYNIKVMDSDISDMFNMIDPLIEFYISEGKQLFRIDDSDERLAKFLGDQFAHAAKYDPSINDKIIINMIKRNDGDERLKFKT